MSETNNKLITVDGLSAYHSELMSAEITPLKDIVDNAAIVKGDGENSAVLLNSGSKATGKNAVAVGSNTHAYAEASHAEGRSSKSTTYTPDKFLGDTITIKNALTDWVGADDSHKFSAAMGLASHVEGRDNLVVSIDAHAEGANNLVFGNRSHAEGYNNIVASNNSHAEGCDVLAGISTDYGSMSGNSLYAHAEGHKTKSLGEAAHAEGKGSTVSSFSVTCSAKSTSFTTSEEHNLSVGTVIQYGDYFAKIISVDDVNKFTTDKAVSNTAISNKKINIVYGVAYGTGSHSEGGNNTAAGTYSHAEGLNTHASGSQAHTEGNNTTALGTSSHVEGVNNTTTGGASHVEGYNNNITSPDNEWGNHVEGGNNTLISGVSSHVEGGYNTVTGNTAHAEGYQNTVSVNNAHAEGKNNTVTGNAAHAEGESNTNSGAASHVEGFENENRGKYGHVEGYRNKSLDESQWGNHIEGGNNTLTTGVNIHIEGGNNTMVSGNITHIEGYLNNVTGDYSHIEGRENTVNAIGSHTEGVGNTNTGNYSHVEGGTADLPNINKSICGHVEGYNNNVDSTAYGIHAEGGANKVLGTSTRSHVEGAENEINTAQNSHVEGYKNVAKNNNIIHIEGRENTVSGNASHAEGKGNTVTSNNAHAEGEGNKVSGTSAHAEGKGNTASGNYSHTSGLGTTAAHEAEFACGKYNVSNADTLFSVGNGSSSAKNNAFEIKTDNTAYVNGSKIATESYVDSAIESSEYSFAPVTIKYTDTKNAESEIVIDGTEELEYDLTAGVYYATTSTTATTATNADKLGGLYAEKYARQELSYSQDANDMPNGLYGGKLYDALNWPQKYFAFLSVGHDKYKMQFNGVNNILMYRAGDDNGLSDKAWKTVAFTDSKVASATTADTATRATYASCDGEGYGIKDTYAKTVDVNKTLEGYATKNELKGKADNSTTLSGYGITNAYTKTEVDNKELMPKLRLNENTYSDEYSNGLISIDAEPNTVSYIVYHGETIDIKLSSDTPGQPYTFIIDVNANFWGQDMIIKTSNGASASVIWANGNTPYSDIGTDYPDKAIEVQLIKYGNKYWFGTWVAYR